MSAQPRASYQIALLVFLVSLTLNIIGIPWGQPGGVPWDFDSIAGLRTFKEGDHLFGEWRDKYPRGQFLILSPVYRALLRRWYGELDLVPRSELKVLDDPDHARRFGFLITLSDTTSALMGAGAVAVAYLTAALLFGDALAALFSALALAFTQTFVFYSHLGDLDTPALFWFACAAWFAVRASRTRAMSDFVLLGLAAAWSVCTKDPTAGYVAGLAIAAGMSMRAPRPGLPRPTFDHVAGACLAFVLTVAVSNDLFFHPDAFLSRVGYWLRGPGIADYNTGYEGQAWLLAQAGRHLYLSLGWPLLAVAAGSALWCLARYPRAAIYCLLPTASFYILVIMNIHMSAPRFYLPALFCLALLVGKGAADWWRWRRLPRSLRYASVTIVFGLSLLYCVGLDLEMLRDTRYDAEAWFEEHVAPGATVAALCPFTIAPRLQLHGYQYDWRWGHPTDRDVLENPPTAPDYLILSEKYSNNPVLFDPGFKEDLLDGSVGYRVVAQFHNRYLWPQRTLFGIAGWPVPKLNQISPEVIVLQKTSPDGA